MDDFVKKVRDARKLRGPILITAHTEDHDYQQPIVDSDTLVEGRRLHRLVEGHFGKAPTPTQFTFYFPPKKDFQLRFFQNLYPQQTHEAREEHIAFSLDNGAYHVQVTGTVGYAHAAATAKFSRRIASNYYDVAPNSINGFIFGGSVGSMQVVSAAENTEGVWQGCVAYVQAIPAGLMVTMTANALVQLVLREVPDHVLTSIALDEPVKHELTSFQSSILMEALQLGLPKKSLELLRHDTRLATFYPMFGLFDNSYSDDFWSKTGYVGTEQSDLGELFRNLRCNQSFRIIGMEKSDGRVEALSLSGLQQGSDCLGAAMTLVDKTGESIATIEGTLTSSKLSLSQSIPTAIAERAAYVHIDNSLYLACHLYHRYQDPEDRNAIGWTQYHDLSGKSVHPQRPSLIGEELQNYNSGGGHCTGKLRMRMMAMCNLADLDLYPWFGDWYRRRVLRALGEETDSLYRLYFNDHADHLDGKLHEHKHGKLVPYDGLISRSLLDLCRWVEDDVSPADSTHYNIIDGQITLPNTAVARLGIQPVVTICVDDIVCANDVVHFTATIEVPPGQGVISSAEWDWEGGGTYEAVDIAQGKEKIELTTSHKYDTPGSRIVGLRATSMKMKSPVYGLGRLRVIVNDE